MNHLDSPLVCICIPTYNAAATIAATLHSVLTQTYANLKILVIDNQSTDATVDIVKKFDDPRITIYCNLMNIGVTGNFNRCIELATSKYTAIYHADDIYEPEMIATQVAFLESYPHASAVFTEASLIDQTGRITGEIRQPASLKTKNSLHDFSIVFKALLRHSNFLVCPSVMTSTYVYRQHIKVWRGDLFGPSADLDVWLRMLEQGPIGILPKKLMRHRISNAQQSENVRMSTNRSAFFTVMDYHLGKAEVQTQLSPVDLINYSRLERRDQVMRATNALINKQPDLAAQLCPDIFSVDLMRSALQSQRGFFVLILTTYIRLMLMLGLYTIASSSLRRIKKIIQK